MTKWPGKSFVDQNKTKTVDGHTYWWCKKHKCFVQHQTSECRLNKPQSSSGNNQSSSTSGPSTINSPPSITVSAATLMEE